MNRANAGAEERTEGPGTRKGYHYILVRSDGAELPLEGDVLYLGRGPDNHIVVNDKMVSRRHSALKREGAHYVLEDLGTTNGTHVNGQRIQRHVLAEGDVIRLGETLFTYRVPG